MKILLFAGAGTSIELGVPGMTGMAEEFLEHAKQWQVEPELVQKIMGSTLDVEHLIEELDRICSARLSLEVIGYSTDSMERLDKIRAEVEWFVQHAAERVVARDARLMWGPVLRATDSLELTLVTTNYDRAIELAANGEQIRLDDGFGAFDQGETAPWVGFRGDSRTARLVKLHGSTDWYADGDLLSPTKLRHPMPLFGRAALRLVDGHQLGSALVLPSREKLLTRDPYPRLSQVFLNAGDACDIAVFVGSSLRDFHIRSAAQAIAHRALVFVVNPEGSRCGVEGAVPISQTASTFLIATLPNAIMAPDPVGALRAAAEAIVDNGSVLNAVREALDRDAPPARRCRALEELDEKSTTLDPFLLRQLLTDSDLSVARYALGLIPLSHAREPLVEAAEGIHAKEDAFREDLDLLREMIRDNCVK